MTENNTDQLPTQTTAQNQRPKTPDDCGIVHVDGYVRIFDPNTNTTLAEVRE